MIDIFYIKEKFKLIIKTTEMFNNIQVGVFEWNTTTDELKEIFIFDRFDMIGENNFIFSDDLFLLKGIKIELRNDNDELVYHKYIRFRNRYGEEIIKQAIVIRSKTGMGDVLLSSPTVRKLSLLYGQKLYLFTHFPELFNNSPYVEKSYDISEFENIKKEKYEIHFLLEENKLIYPHIDMRQIPAIGEGFILDDNELEVDFYPDDFIPFEMPDRYVCINPSITYSDRTWGYKNWQELVDMLQPHIPIIAIGKVIETGDFLNVTKNFSNLKISNGLNLCGKKCQNSLSQTYHIIDKSITFITMNTGLYHLARTTDAHITELATPWDSSFYRKRKGVENYKLNFISGECKLKCTSSLSCSVNDRSYHRESIHVHKNIVLSNIDHQNYSHTWWYKGECYLNYKDYKCHPTPKQVYEEIIKIL